MRKQVGYNIITANIGYGESGSPKTELLARIQNECPFEDGWEVMSTEIGQVAAQTVYVLVALAQYKDVPESKASAK